MPLLLAERFEEARDAHSNQQQVSCGPVAPGPPGRRDRAPADRQQSIGFWYCAFRSDNYRFFANLLVSAETKTHDTIRIVRKGTSRNERYL